MVGYNNEILLFESIKDLKSFNLSAYRVGSDEEIVQDAGATMKVVYIKWMAQTNKGPMNGG